jgi:hypothetical protein
MLTGRDHGKNRFEWSALNNSVRSRHMWFRHLEER